MSGKSDVGKPNILVIWGDDIGLANLSCYSGGLRHRDERDIMLVKELDQLGEVGKRPRQPVDLVDDDHIDPSGANVVQQLRQSRPVHGAAGASGCGVLLISSEMPEVLGLSDRLIVMPFAPREPEHFFGSGIDAIGQ